MATDSIDSINGPKYCFSTGKPHKNLALTNQQDLGG
jgi:hypothetical protein